MISVIIIEPQLALPLVLGGGGGGAGGSSPGPPAANVCPRALLTYLSCHDQYKAYITANDADTYRKTNGGGLYFCLLDSPQIALHSTMIITVSINAFFLCSLAERKRWKSWSN